MKIDKKFPEQPSVLPVPADLHSEQGLRSEQSQNLSAGSEAVYRRREFDIFEVI